MATPSVILSIKYQIIHRNNYDWPYALCFCFVLKVLFWKKEHPYDFNNENIN